MGFQYLWPLGLLILIPVIVIMYLLRQKTEPHPFSSLFLWNETYRNLHSDTPWEKLKKSLLMLMQIVTVIALIIALMAPYVRSRNSVSQHIILVIDNSASMKTKYDSNNTRLDVAIASATKFVDGLRSGSSVTVITSNKEAALVISDSADKTLVNKRIRAIEPTTYAGTCDAASTLARSMAAQWLNCEIIYYTDSAVSNGFGTAKGYISEIYSDVDNAFIDYVGHGKNADGTLTILAKVTNNTSKTLTCETNLYGDGKIIEVSRPLNIEAGKSDIIYFENVNFKGKTVCVELNNFKDALMEDNMAYDVVSEIKSCNALLMTKRNLYLEKAIGLINGISVTKSEDTASFQSLIASSKYDLFIFDGMLPEKLPESGNMIFINITDEEILKKSGETTNLSLTTVASKLTSYLTNFTFGISKGSSVDCPVWADKFLVTASDGKQQTLGCFGNYNGRNICYIGFDFHDSDLPLKMEFPILIYNIMSECASTGILQSTVVNSGNPVMLSGVKPGSETTITTPSNKTVKLSGAVSSYSDTQEIGAYSITRVDGSDRETEAFVVNFPKSESSVFMSASQSSGGGNVVKTETAATSTLNLRNIIILISLALLAIEWFVYIRGL